MKKMSMSVALAACALAVPSLAVAHGKPEGVGKSGRAKAEQAHGKSGAAHGKSHKCKTHNVGYVYGGTLAEAGTLTAAADGGYTGAFSVDVKRANRFARALKGEQTTLDVAGVRVRLGDGLAAGELPAGTRVQVIGKVTSVAKKCDQSAAGTVTIKKVVFTAAASDDSASDDTTTAPTA